MESGIKKLICRELSPGIARENVYWPIEEGHYRNESHIRIFSYSSV
jgi:hypothetical protein